MKTRPALFFIIAALILCFSAQASAQADQEIVSVTDSPDPVASGGNITYTIVVRNNGPNSAVNGGVNVTLDSNLTYVSATAPAGFSCAVSGSNISCTTPSFAPGTVTITVIATLSQHLQAFPAGNVTSTFTTSGTTSDPVSTNNSETETTAYVTPDADISVSATDSPDPVSRDGSITYTVTVSNSGPDTAPNVRLNVLLNNTLRFQSITIPAGFTCPNLPPPGGGTSFTCTNPSMSAGASAVFTIVLHANEEHFGANSQTIVQNFNVNSDINDPDINDNDVSVSTQYAGVTAASVTVTGRVTMTRGRGIRNALVRLVDENGEVRTVVTSPLGYYRFADVAAGRSYTVSVTAKGHTFVQPAQLVSLAGDTDGINFVSEN